MRSLLLCLPILAACAARAANGQMPPPSPAECTSFVSAMNGGSHNPLQWPQIAACGSAGASALSTALRNARTLTDTVYLRALLNELSAIRDNGVFTTARSVGGDATATVVARLTAFLAAMAQIDNSGGMRVGKSYGDILANTTEANCYWQPGTSDSYYKSTPTALADAALRLKRTLDSTYYSAAPLVVRSFARCLRFRIPYGPVPTAPTSAVIVSYVCGNRFKFQNTGVESIMLTYDVDTTGVPEQGDVTVPAGESRTVTMRKVGPVDTYLYGGARFDAKKRNLGTVCP